MLPRLVFNELSSSYSQPLFKRAVGFKQPQKPSYLCRGNKDEWQDLRQNTYGFLLSK